MSDGEDPTSNGHASRPLSADLPRAIQIEQILRQRVVRDYKAGDRLASEPQLAREFGVSRTLIRAAIAKLQKSGLVTRAARHGTFVHPPAQNEDTFDLSDVIGGFITYDASWNVDVLSISTVSGYADIRSRLHLVEEEGLIRIEQQISRDDEQLSVTLSYVPFRHAMDFTKIQLKAKPISRLISDKGDVIVDRVDQTIQPQLADLDQVRYLNVSLGAPVLGVERTYFDDARRPIFFSQSFFRGGKYRIEFVPRHGI